ncbi:MAG: desulfoferrodoxin [Candidatus Aenigmarchaeota archaeon]|nr:desulfoferrodoxin [Candidatus Aenigmarchaeota archaeon]
MAEFKAVYKCEICGNVVEVVHEGAGELVCCGQPMKHMKENTVDAAKEKHVPVIEKIDENRVKVKVGSVGHPMTEDHYIEFIEVVTEDRVLRKYLKPGEKPEKEFNIKGGTFKAREYCNIHGLWISS